MTPGPLDGVRVVELTSLVPGPFAGAILVGYGATVAKVEPPSGDILRRMQPDMFRLCNRGKASVVLDLKSGEGRAALETLLAGADVLLTSFRTGAQRRLGVDAAALRERHPCLVHVSICGFADPEDPRPGHDLNYLAESGAVHLFGLGREADAAVLRFPLADLGGAQFAATAVAAGLYQRATRGTAAPVVVSLHASAVALTRTRAAEVLARQDGRAIDDTIAKPGYGTFVTSDGRWVAIAALEDHHWQPLAEVLDLGEDLASLPYPERLRRVRELNAAVGEAIAGLPAERLLAPGVADLFAATPVADLDAAPVALSVPGGTAPPDGGLPELGADTERLLVQWRVAR